MKLINPDYIANDDNFNAGGMERMQKGHHNSHSLGNIAASLGGGLKPIPQKSRSREAMNHLGSNQQLSAGGGGGGTGLKLANGGGGSSSPASNGSNSNGGMASGEEDVIFTTARPATVISSTTSNSSSPASELLMGKHHLNEDHLKMSPSRKQQSPYANGGGILKNGGPSPAHNGTATNGGSGGGKIPLPDMKEMDWSSLVDTATKAMTQFSETVAKSQHPGSNVYYDDISQVLNGVHHHQQQQQQQAQQIQQHQTQQLQQMAPGTTNGVGGIPNGAASGSSISGTGSSIGSGADLSSTPSSASPVSTGSSSAQHQALMALQNSSSLPELQSQVSQLSDRVLREQRRRRSLEHAVRRLTEENRRLQDESQAAVQQLRRFTEWFFQTIDRQS